MTSFAEKFAAARRQWILRFLVEAGGVANDSVIISAARMGGFEQTPATTIRADLDHLEKGACIVQEWIETTAGLAPVRVVKVSEKGEDVAYGRISVDGVEALPWRRY